MRPLRLGPWLPDAAVRAHSRGRPQANRLAGKLGALARVSRGTSEPRDTLSQTLLADAPDSHVLVLPDHPEAGDDALTAAWKVARDDALSAYEAWRDGTGPDAFVVYRAAADREQAAAAALAAQAHERRTRWYRRLAG